MESPKKIIFITGLIVLLVILIVTIILIKKSKKKEMRRKVLNLDIIKNDILSLPLLNEIEKVARREN